MLMMKTRAMILLWLRDSNLADLVPIVGIVAAIDLRFYLIDSIDPTILNSIFSLLWLNAAVH